MTNPALPSGSHGTEGDSEKKKWGYKREQFDAVITNTRLNGAVDRLIAGTVQVSALLAVLDELNGSNQQGRYMAEMLALKKESRRIATAPFSPAVAEFLTLASRRMPMLSDGLASQLAVTLASAADNHEYLDTVNSVVGQLLFDLDHPLKSDTRNYLRALTDKIDATRRLLQARAQLATVPSVYPPPSSDMGSPASRATAHEVVGVGGTGTDLPPEPSPAPLPVEASVGAQAVLPRFSEETLDGASPPASRRIALHSDAPAPLDATFANEASSEAPTAVKTQVMASASGGAEGAALAHAPTLLASQLAAETSPEGTASHTPIAPEAAPAPQVHAPEAHAPRVSADRTAPGLGATVPFVAPTPSHGQAGDEPQRPAERKSRRGGVAPAKAVTAPISTQEKDQQSSKSVEEDEPLVIPTRGFPWGATLIAFGVVGAVGLASYLLLAKKEMGFGPAADVSSAPSSSSAAATPAPSSLHPREGEKGLHAPETKPSTPPKLPESPAATPASGGGVPKAQPPASQPQVGTAQPAVSSGRVSTTKSKSPAVERVVPKATVEARTVPKAPVAEPVGPTKPAVSERVSPKAPKPSSTQEGSGAPSPSTPKLTQNIDKILADLRQVPGDTVSIEAQAYEVARIIARSAKPEADHILSRLTPEELLFGTETYDTRTLEPIRRVVALLLEKVAVDKDDARAAGAIEMLGEWAKSRKHGGAAKLTLDKLAEDPVILSRPKRRLALERVQQKLGIVPDATD